MPRMDGLTALRYLKSKPALAVVPVIVLTSREGTIDRLKARLAGASEYLTKPFTQEQIVAFLHGHLALPAQIAPTSPLTIIYFNNKENTYDQQHAQHSFTPFPGSV
jgi:DNA-binding response OmpR family regulator